MLGHPEQVGDHRNGAGNRVAESHHPEPEGGEEHHVHGHRVGVIEDQRFRAHLVNVLRQFIEGTDAAQETHDAAGVQGVSGHPINAVLSGDFKVRAISRDAAHLKRQNHVIGVLQGLFLVVGGVDVQGNAVVFTEGPGCLQSFLGALQVEVHQHQFAGVQDRGGQHVGHEGQREDHAPCTDHHDFFTVSATSLRNPAGFWGQIHRGCSGARPPAEIWAFGPW